MKQCKQPGCLALALAICALAVCADGCKRNGEGRVDAVKNREGLRQREIQNVILISIDTLRADHVACYSHDSIKTPNIDALAGEGILFERHINASTTTLPSHTSMFTGTYPHLHGVPRNGFRVGDENIMLPEVLKEAGFATAGFIGAAPLVEQTNFDQGFDHFGDEFGWIEGMGQEIPRQRRADEVTDAVLAWLSKRFDDMPEDRKGKSRLFLFVHFFDVHWPYMAPEPYGGMYRTDSLKVNGSMESIKRTRNLLKFGYHLPETEDSVVGSGLSRAQTPSDPFRRSRWETGLAFAQALDAEYCAEITFCDHHLGRLVEGLKQHKLFDSSLVVMTSDHGETMHEHDNVFNHGAGVYDTEILTPLILRFPDGKYGGRRVSRLVSSIDLMPTILEFLGLSIHHRIEGESFASVIDSPLPLRAPVFAEATQPWDLTAFDDDPVWPNRGKYQCIRSDRYKYILRIPDQQSRLFDLVADPQEQTNLLNGEHEYDTALVADLNERLLTWRDDADPIDSELLTIQDHIEALRSLGYIGDSPDDTREPNRQLDDGS